MSEKNFASYGDMETLVTEIVDKCGPYTEISYEDWLQLTPYQQEHGRWDVTGVPGADGTISIDLMTKLWENPDPTVDFAAQDISLANSNYDLLMIVAKHRTTNLYQYTGICSKGSTCRIIGAGGTGPVIMHRDFSYLSDTSYHVESGYEGTTASVNVMIPIVIYGIKLHHTVEIKAIAPEVSTLASKCMLSDGETSVEDAIGNIHFKTFKYTYTGATAHGTMLSISDAKADVFVIPASANIVGIAWQGIQGNQRYVSTRPSYNNDTLYIDPDVTNSALLIFSGVVMYT